MINGKRHFNGIHKPIKGVKKMCFECFKWFPVKKFKLVVREGIWVRDDYCKICYDEKRYRPYHKPTLQDFDQMKFIIGFMGNSCYKEVCKMFSIRYDD